MRTAANPLPANRAKTAPGRAANVRGDNPPPEPAGRILPPKNPPHLTDCRRLFPPPCAAANGRRMHPAAGMHLTNYPPPRAANGGRRMHRAGPARRRRTRLVRGGASGRPVPHSSRRVASASAPLAAEQGATGGECRIASVAGRPTSPPPSGGGEGKCTANVRRGAEGNAVRMAAPRTGGNVAGAAGVGARRRIPPPEFGEGEGGGIRRGGGRSRPEAF